MIAPGWATSSHVESKLFSLFEELVSLTRWPQCREVKDQWRAQGHLELLQVTMVVMGNLRTGKSWKITSKQTCKAKIGFKMLHNRLAMCSPSFATMLMSATLDRLSIPASMKGLSNSRSSSLAIASFNRNMWKPDAANNEALSKIAVQQKLLLT